MTTVSSLSVQIGADIAGLQSGLKTADSGVKGFASRASSGLKSVGDTMVGLGGSITMLTAPLALLGGMAVNSAMQFNESMTNVGAVLGKTQDEMAGLSAEILAIGANTRAGPQEVANAFYDIVGGVADASTHMDILNAAIATAEAGNANLTGTTSALIAVMNSYGLSADDATMASDVLTRTVQMGVGTMDELASAMPQVATLAASMGISFDELGGMMAFASTKGLTFAEAGTQIRAMMTAMLNPNETMKDGLEELGFASGQAAVDALGLVGAYEALQGTQTANTEGFAKMTGSVEALNGAIILTGEGAGEFFGTFSEGLDGATAAAQELQNASPAAQMELLNSKIQALSITIGTALLPMLNGIVQKIEPVIAGITEWITANPQLAQTLGMIGIAAVVLGPTLAILGTIISGIGVVVGVVTTGFGLLTTAVGLLFSPVTLIIGAIAGLLALLGSGEGGLIGGLNRAATAATQLVELGLVVLIGALNGLSQAATVALNALGSAFTNVFNFINNSVIQPFIGVLDGVLTAINGILEGIGLVEAKGFKGGPNPALAGNAPGMNNGNGFATGLPYVPNDGLYLLHRGEEVLTKSQARAGAGGGGGGVVVNLTMYGSAPREVAEMVQRELRAAGI